MSKSYVLSLWLALLVHTGGHGIHVCFVCIVSLVSWFLLLFDVILSSVHARPSGPRRCRSHLVSFWLQQGEPEVQQNLKRISMKWLSGLSVCQWQHYTMLMLFVFAFEVSVVYRYVVNFREVADATRMCSIANFCIIVVGDPDQK